MRESLWDGQQEGWRATAVRLLLAEFPFDAHDRPDTWARSARLRPHVLAAERQSEDEAAQS